MIIKKETKHNRGDARRQAIIMAALEIFGEYGIKGATVRLIANKAGANVAAIPYYFGGKDGLYTALVTYITTQIGNHMNNIMADISPTMTQDDLSPEEALSALKHIMSGIATIIIETDEPKAWAKIITREQANPTDAFEILYDGFIRDNHIHTHHLIAVYTGRSKDDEAVKIMAHTLFGQMLGFLICREDMLRALNTTQLAPSQVASIKSILEGNIEHCLNSLRFN